MLSFFTYPHKLADAMRAIGYKNEDMPLTREWIGLIHEFRKAGYTPERAARVIDGANYRDPKALGEALAIGGVYAIAMFGQ